jgi:hypothetical protein
MKELCQCGRAAEVTVKEIPTCCGCTENFKPSETAVSLGTFRNVMTGRMVFAGSTVTVAECLALEPVYTSHLISG